MEREFYEDILNKLPIACACIKVIRDSKGKFYDSEYINMNAAFEDITGIVRNHIVHKKVHSLINNNKLSKRSIEWIRICNELIQKGENESVKYHYKNIDCWFRLGIKKLTCGSDHVLLHIEDISLELEKLNALRQEADMYKHMSFHDSLTKLYNRAFFDVELERLSSERSLPLSIIIADVNDLKRTNDTLGHHIGDLLLQKTAKVLKSCCREEDIIARVGGDEFKVLLPRTSHKDAEKIVDRLLKTCNKTYVAGKALSVSFGWETKTKKYEDMNKIQRRAEEKMYRCKLRLKKNIGVRV